MTPYEEGYQAHKNEWGKFSNPYISESRNWYLWNNGYNSYDEYEGMGYFGQDEEPYIDEDRPY